MNLQQRSFILLLCSSLAACYTQHYQSLPIVYDANYNYADVIDVPGYALNESSYVHASRESVVPNTRVIGIMPAARLAPVINVPESYHVGQFRAPISSEANDHQWIMQQNLAFYTIELADNAQPAIVAKQLYLAPKTARMAEFKYRQNGIVRYKGVYGSYRTFEEAQMALQQLPPALRTQAQIRQWSQIQQMR